MSKLSYPANKPTVAGYYGVLYNNPEKDGQEYVKCLWWNTHHFVWRIPDIDQHVTVFFPETHHQYYTPSEELLTNIGS